MVPDVLLAVAYVTVCVKDNKKKKKRKVPLRCTYISAEHQERAIRSENEIMQGEC
jgi:hypothetical protein